MPAVISSVADSIVTALAAQSFLQSISVKKAYAVYTELEGVERQVLVVPATDTASRLASQTITHPLNINLWLIAKVDFEDIPAVDSLVYILQQIDDFLWSAAARLLITTAIRCDESEIDVCNQDMLRETGLYYGSIPAIYKTAR